MLCVWSETFGAGDDDAMGARVFLVGVVFAVSAISQEFKTRTADCWLRRLRRFVCTRDRCDSYSACRSGQTGSEPLQKKRQTPTSA